MKDQRKYFRYQFPDMDNTICTDDEGRRLLPIDISHGGIGFRTENKRKVGTVEEIHLLEFLSVKVRIMFCSPLDKNDDSEKLFKVGAEFQDYILTPAKLIEFLEIHMITPKDD